MLIEDIYRFVHRIYKEISLFFSPRIPSLLFEDDPKSRNIIKTINPILEIPNTFIDGVVILDISDISNKYRPLKVQIKIFSRFLSLNHKNSIVEILENKKLILELNFFQRDYIAMSFILKTQKIESWNFYKTSKKCRYRKKMIQKNYLIVLYGLHEKQVYNRSEHQSIIDGYAQDIINQINLI